MGQRKINPANWKRASSLKHYMKNLEQARLRNRERRRLHPHRAKSHQLKFFYGITIQDMWAMQRKQKNRCGICKRKRPLCVDHNRKQQYIRGLLCRGCNSSLGHFLEDKAVLRRAIRWLSKRTRHTNCKRGRR